MKNSLIKLSFNTFFFVKILFSTSLVAAQEEIIPLKKHLSILERKFKVKFSYSNNIVKGKYIENNIYNESIIKNLKKLEKHFFITSKKINDRYFILSIKKQP